MKRLPLAGLIGLASLAGHAQIAPLAVTHFAEPVLVTATRAVNDAQPTLRDAVVITRADLEAADGLTLAELLQRRAGVEMRANGGPGQPASIFLRGASGQQTLVLVDGLRVGSATSGATAIEAIPLEMIERVEIVKGPMSGLWGSDAIGGVVQIFTRGRDVPHLFAAAAVGSERERRASAGIATADADSSFSLSAGYREIDARSASNPRAFGHDPDRDPHENGFVTLRGAHRLWNGEMLAVEAFGSRSRTFFDAGDPGDRSIQSLAGGRISSSTEMMPWWAMKLAFGHSRDKQRTEGGFPSVFETRQDQATWVNDFKVPGGTALLGAEYVRQRVRPETDDFGARIFAVDERKTDSVFASLNQSWGVQRLEANLRRDHDDQYGTRNTGALSWGATLAATLHGAVTIGRGFRAPSFNDLYLISFLPFYRPNPDLLPERSRSREATLKSLGPGTLQWRLTAFDNRVEDLVTLTTDSVTNLDRARIRGLEASVETALWGARLRGQFTVQRPRDERTGAQLRLRAKQYGSVEATRAFGAVTVSAAAVASGARFDSNDESPASRLPGYTRFDARVRYAMGRHWAVELTAVNLADKRYETAAGYDAPRRGLLLGVRFDAL